MVISDLSRSTLQLCRAPRVEGRALASCSPARGRRSSPLKAGTCLTMAATTTKPAYTVRWRDEENERTLRKLFFTSAADIPDQMLSSLAQLRVRIALKLLELLRAHRVAHAVGGAYVPPDDATQDNWMQTDSDLVEAVEELEAGFNTQYVKDKIDATTCRDAAECAAKRARKKYTRSAGSASQGQPHQGQHRQRDGRVEDKSAQVGNGRGKPPDKPPDKPLPDKQAPAVGFPPRGGARGRARGGGRGRGRCARGALEQVQIHGTWGPPEQRRSAGGRGGGWRLRQVAVAGRGAADRSVCSDSARAAAPGSLSMRDGRVSLG